MKRPDASELVEVGELVVNRRQRFGRLWPATGRLLQGQVGSNDTMRSAQTAEQGFVQEVRIAPDAGGLIMRAVLRGGAARQLRPGDRLVVLRPPLDLEASSGQPEKNDRGM